MREEDGGRRDWLRGEVEGLGRRGREERKDLLRGGSGSVRERRKKGEERLVEGRGSDG